MTTFSDTWPQASFTDVEIQMASEAQARNQITAMRAHTEDQLAELRQEIAKRDARLDYLEDQLYQILDQLRNLQHDQDNPALGRTPTYPEVPQIGANGREASARIKCPQ
jgi:predicted  nucleic acid-binding Zn-ribbon protein